MVSIRADFLGLKVSSVLFLLAALAPFFSDPAEAAAGRTKGTLAVSPTGAATYTIPIWAPPGPQGIQPRIALTYSSQQGNGPVGVGWAISGLSSIYRCNLTFAQDAAPAPVALVTSDGYCMDGQRLRLTSGTYGADSSTYQTEIANFVNVTAHGTQGNGPGYFTAQDRNGRSYTYGNGGTSQVLATGSNPLTAESWLLNEVSDPAGNTMTIAYTTPAGTVGTAVPSKISWTPSSHGSSTYNYTMSFAYGTNVAPPQGYVGGTSFKNPNLLSSIAVNYTGTAVKTYYLTYQASATTGDDVLTQVQECAGSGTSNCLLPTVMNYQGATTNTAGVSTTATTAIPSSGMVLLYVNYDFNGDGYKDLVYCNGGSPNIVYVAFGSATGYGAPHNTGINCLNALYGDVQGTGRDGILAPNGSTWYYYTWNGNSFAGVPTGLAYDSTASQYLLADVNGDGLPDLISSYFKVSKSGVNFFNVYTDLNTTPAGGAPGFSSTTTLAYSTHDSTLAAAQLQSVQQYGPGKGFDFNGDGRQDLSVELVYCSGNCSYSTYELISTGTTFNATWIATIPASNYIPVFFLNFNSDACTDYLTGGTIYISGCNGSVPATVSLGSANVIAAMDWNGDGLTDILVQNGSTIGVYESTGAGISSLISTSIPYSSNNQYLSFDANGDGLDDLGVWVGANATAGNGQSSVTYYVHNGAGQPPDLLSSVTDAYGNSASPTYLPLTNSSFYTKGSDAVYPYQNYIGPLYAVRQLTLSDPSSASGGTYTHTYSYFWGWMNLQGRGFGGFSGGLTDTDSRTGVNNYPYYRPDFPYTGMLKEDWVTQPNTGATFTSKLTNTLTYTTLSSTQYNERYFPYVESSTLLSYELGGTENGDLISTTVTNYTPDNYGNPTQVATTVTDNDPGSPYAGNSWTTTVTNTPDVDTTHWCLGLFTETQVAYSSTLSGSNSVTRTKSFTPDTTNCRYNEIVTEPSSSQFKVTEDLAYDSFGNVTTDKITGINMAARTTTINWTSSTVTSGQFPMSVTDPSNATTLYNYNFSYGLISSITDPNNLPTAWQYTDGFGRKNQETRPDGTYTTWSYYDCAPSCLIGSHGTDITHYVYAVGGTVITDGTDYTDPVERPILSNKRMLASGTYDRNEVRYDSLGRIRQRAFPCTWSSLTTTCTYWTTNTYDVLNRLTQSQRPINSTNSTLQTTTYAYAGRTTTVSDPQSNAKTIVTDVNGWLRQTKDAYGYNVAMAYDAAGSKTSVTDSLGNSLWSATYNYGIGAFPATVTDMDMGKWLYTFDALGEQTGWTDAKNQPFGESYDALSRPSSRSEPDYFTKWTWGSSASSHNIGKLQSVCTGVGSSPTSCTASGYSESETYDSRSRLSQRSITIPGQSETFKYTWAYNATTGLLNTLTYPASYPSTYSLEVQYGYSNGILKTITDISDTPNVTVWTADATNPAGQITQQTLGNGIVTNRTYDAVTSWLASVQSGVGGGSAVQNFAFLYDEMGNVTQRQDNNLGLTENIYYDHDYRFSYSKLNGTQNLSVAYDSMGNITSRSDLAGAASWTYSPTQKHAVTQAGSSAYQYSYDANGNAKTRQGSTIVWSSYNYPIAIGAGSGSTAETVGLEYGPDRQRWQQSYTGNGTAETTDYIGGLLDFVSSGGVLDYRHYIYGGGQVVAVYSRKSTGVKTFSYTLSDHQASVAGITNSSGGVVVKESFTPFGHRRNPSTWSGAASNSDLTTAAGITRQGYTSQTQLGLWTGLNHMNGRVEDAVTGRMMSADPYIPDVSNAQNYNSYSYVNNNPLSFTDPTGFTQEKLCQASVEGACNTGNGETLAETLPPVDVNGQIPSPDSNPAAVGGLSVQPASGGPSQDPGGLGEIVVHGQRPKDPPKLVMVLFFPIPVILAVPMSQETLQTPCDLGNVLQKVAQQGAKAGRAMEAAGVGAATIGLFAAGPDGVIPGATLAAVGGVTQVGSSAAQLIGGALQSSQDPSAGKQNMLAGGASLIVAGGFFYAPGALSPVASNYVARAYSEQLKARWAIAGAAADTAKDLVPDMEPQQATCGPH